MNLKRLASKGRTHEMNEELEAGDREEAVVGGGAEPGQGQQGEGARPARAGACAVLLPMPPGPLYSAGPGQYPQRLRGGPPWIPPWLWGEQVCYCWA